MNGKGPVRIFLVDDHQIMLDGLKAILGNWKGCTLIGEALNGQAALAKLDQLEVDFLITDISMPEMDGITLTATVKKQFPLLKVLALSMFNDHPNIVAMLEAGANGYILKNSTREEFIEAIEVIAAGGVYYSREVADEMMRALTQQKQKPEPTATVRLTDREMEVVRLIACEMSNAEIADKLFISERTVETHRKNIQRKLNTKNVVGLIRYAIDNGLVG